jgi:hypothetical protein
MQTVVLQVLVSSSQRVVVDWDCLFASATEFEKYMPDIINIPKTNIAGKPVVFLRCMIIRNIFPASLYLEQVSLSSINPAAAGTVQKE